MLESFLYKGYAIVQQIEMDTLEDFKIKLKAQEIKKDDCTPIKYGLEEQATKSGWKSKRVKFIITYYYADSTPLQGGYLDRYGKELLSYDIPICAAPDDIPYGSVMVLDHPVNGSNEYKIVDTGGAIRWVDSETCRIDIFVPEAKCIKDITSKYTNKIVTGKIYYKQ